ncbi:MAG: hypothetical protein JWQ27_2134 [Ferruginibacter sp.]|nr:hypothetical protein [Ferruginibacter sp.]
MCYDVSFTVDLKQLSDYFPHINFDEQIEMNFDGTHILGHLYGAHPILYKNATDDDVHCRPAEWGCIPFYVKDKAAFSKQRPSMLNARSERVLDDPKSYWNKIRNRRCLVPVTGFYEHREVKGMKNKVPYFISLKKQPLFFLPGLYSVTELLDKETGELYKLWTYTILTRDANPVMKGIHNGGENKWRMPLMLPLEMAKNWMEKELPEERYRDIINFEMPSEELDYHPVFSIRTSKLRPDDQPKNAFYEWPNLPELASS